MALKLVAELNQQLELFGLTPGEAQALRLLLCGQKTSAALIDLAINVTTILLLKDQGYIEKQGAVWDITDAGLEALSIYEAKRLRVEQGGVT